jgi:hypothetical protein
LIVIIALIYFSLFYNKVKSRPVLFIGSIKVERIYSNKERKEKRIKRDQEFLSLVLSIELLVLDFLSSFKKS